MITKNSLKALFLSLTAGLILISCETMNLGKEPTAQELIKNGEIDKAKSLFQIRSDINEIDEDGNTVLHLAAMIDDADLVTYFIIKGADVHLRNRDGDSPLHVAIKNRSFNAAKVLCVKDTCLFDENIQGRSALEEGLKTDPAFYDLFICAETGSLIDKSGKTIVHYFVEQKNIQAIKLCAKKGIPNSIKDYKGKTPLDYAFGNIDDYSSVEIAAELILGGAEEVETEFSYFQDALTSRNINVRFDDGQTPLHLSSINGHVAITKYLLLNGANTQSQDSSGATPLHEAIRYGNLEIAKMLLDAGANVNAKDNLGKTPILLIIPQDKIAQTYDLLIKNNADLNAKDMYGDTILHTAAMLKVNVSILENLTAHGADINARNKEGVTPLEITIKQEDVATTKLFTTHGANIHTKDTNGSSPLLVALTSSNEIFEATVNEMNVETQDSEGNTPLHLAIMNDAPLAKIQYIVSLTKDVNIRNRDGNSALYYAILKNRQKVGEMLLTKNADIFSTNTNNNSPLRLALKYGGTVQDWLITSKTIKSKDGTGNTVLHYAAEWQYKDAISSLVMKGADISAKNANGETPLFNAVKTNNPEIIQIVVDSGADIHARDNLGSTVMHTAVRWDAPKSIDKLLALGINVNAQNTSGKSPLAEAVVAGKFDIAKKLLASGADPNTCDSNGVTVLMDAIRGCSRDSVKLLLGYGANPNVQEVNGQNAYHEAAYMADIDIIRLIRNAGGIPLSRDKQGNTPFSIVLKKDINVIREVLGNNYTITDSDGNTPVHIVVKANASDELLQTLIDEGYPVDTRNADGYTALNYAIENDDVKTALVLLENGANPFQQIDKKGKNGISIALEKGNKKMISNIVKYAGKMTDVQGNTILHYAAKTCTPEMVKTLISYGIDKSVKNVSGDTAYTIAVRWRRPEIAALLK
jgi:ankyrin repeat protein